MRNKGRHRKHDGFASIKVEGALLPHEILQRLAGGENEKPAHKGKKIKKRSANLPGTSTENYHLAPNETLNEVVSRSWNRLLGTWRAFKEKRATIPQDSHATGMTRDHWLLHLFNELGYGRLQTCKVFEIDEKTYPISHLWGHTPIHLVGCGVNLDRRFKGLAGAAHSSPHSLLQEFLNRSEEHLWGFLSNGLKLRLLRDNISLTRQSYVEFDLEIMMEGELYTDFLLLWLVCHQSRVEAGKPGECYLEQWHRAAIEKGIRILDHLRDGVKSAIEKLGCGFLAHPSNKELTDKLEKGEISTPDFYRQLLRLVYRQIFLLVAESRDLLLLPDATPEAKQRYKDYYSLLRLRRLARKKRGSHHGDMWQGLRLVFQLLSRDEGYEKLALPGLGSFLWSSEALPDLETCSLDNRHLLEALYYLTTFSDGVVRHPVDYRNLGPEELGSVYESLLELHPQAKVPTARFTLAATGGNERKTTGSYYTPRPLIISLLDSALDPILRRCRGEEEVLALKICDPACGSGHFLIAAANRMGRRLATLRTGEEEPDPASLRKALRDVIGHCIYGVDINPMAVELCKVGLWMEALEPGKPLSFLDHRILCGNSLVGSYPSLIEKGIPDAAFSPIIGDDKKICQKYKALNKQERGIMGARSLFDAAGNKWFGSTNLEREFIEINRIDDSTRNGIKEKEEVYYSMTASDGYLAHKLVADAWCAAFAWEKKETEALPYPIHEEVFRSIKQNPLATPGWLKKEIDRLAGQYGFFHYHLAFPDVFHVPQAGQVAENPHTGWSGGFDVVLGNPPWERIKLQEKEWFAQQLPEIANAPNAAKRRQMINKLETEDPAIFAAFQADRRKAEGESHFVRNSQRFPLCGRGDVNTFAPFAELMRGLISLTGRTGCIVPSGIATDDTTKYFFSDLVTNRSLVSLYDFENRKKLFQAVDSRMKFCLLTLSGAGQPVEKGAEFLFFAHDTADLEDKERRFTLSNEELSLLNPNTKTCPIFRTKRDAGIVKSIYKRIPVLIDENKPIGNPWGITFLRMIDMANDSHLFKTRDQLEREGWTMEGNIFYKGNKKYLPLYEAKMMQMWDHRAADVIISEKAVFRKAQPSRLNLTDHRNPNRYVMPLYWVSEKNVDEIIKRINYPYEWLLGFTDVTSSTNERTLISSIIPCYAVGHKMPLFIFNTNNHNLILTFTASLNSFVLDYIVRQKIGGTSMAYFILKQLPVLPPETYEKPTPWQPGISLAEWIKPRVLELTYTAWDLEDFAKDCGYEGEPFPWDEERRFQLRCELDAAFFHLYGISLEDADYIMETFPIVKRKDEQATGSYRTKETILEIYKSYTS